MKETIQIAIEVTDENIREQLIALLSVNDYDAFEEKGDELICFIDSENFDEEFLAQVLSGYNLMYNRSTVKEQNWNALWESNFQPVVVDEFCAIRAHFHPPFTSVRNEIIITPKMSFGTGHHATTYMMISAMSELTFDNKRIADFGTGTGVLAILAEKLGSEFVWAVDIDDWSIENATENFEKNACKKITIEKADAFNANESFDIILANINKNVILANADNLAAHTKLNGQLLLSGLLIDDEKDIVSAFSLKGFTHISTIERNRWICLLFLYE